MIVHFSAHISKWELVCKFGVIFHIFIISCLCSRFHVRNQWFFYSVITFSYIKCFVHSYTVDVVFTLSYMNMKFHSWNVFLRCLRHNSTLSKTEEDDGPRYLDNILLCCRVWLYFVVIMYVINRNNWWFKNEYTILEGKIIGQYASVIPDELLMIMIKGRHIRVLTVWNSLHIYNFVPKYQI